jgi:hypothetical protein
VVVTEGNEEDRVKEFNGGVICKNRDPLQTISIWSGGTQKENTVTMFSLGVMTETHCCVTPDSCDRQGD